MAASSRHPCNEMQRAPEQVHQPETDLVASSAVRAGNGPRDRPGTSCHQCRQKTLKNKVACSTNVNNIPCKIKICERCLRDWYGERVEAAEASLWKCPRCRGICLCSICIKKEDKEAIGKFSSKIKKLGYSSVIEYLNRHQDSTGTVTGESLGRLSSLRPLMADDIGGDGEEEAISQLFVVAVEKGRAKMQMFPNTLPHSFDLVSQVIHEECKRLRFTGKRKLDKSQAGRRKAPRK